ncbi:hypothetical protein [Lewinella sp. W8]|uniref:hypothetical protein n=1 Tax=Lewinella sp. W8 TaxID=2528208 RepID=UPI0010680BB7|nr:hypothetical protein [Lewinella sp. W8]MTB52128.1 hypothetical protein [Lewinella sp. W8]
MRLFALLLFSALTFSLSAQDINANVDEVGILAYRTTTTSVEEEAVSKRYRKYRERTLLGDLDLSGAWGGPTYNYSMTGDDWALVRGGFGGLEFGEEFFLGYGGWKARDPFTTDEDVVDRPDYNFRHGGFILAYSPLRESAIHPRITTIIGPGRIDFANANGENIRDRMLIGQAMAGLELNLFQWFRLGVEGGYRFASGVDVEGDLISDKDVGGAVVQIEARFGFSW